MLEAVIKKQVKKLVAKKITPEAIDNFYQKSLGSLPLVNGEHQNVFIISREPDGKMYASVLGLTYKDNQFILGTQKMCCSVESVIKDMLENPDSIKQLIGKTDE